ncbi:MAG TPA: type I-E CRISPR-associated protein Cas6/Cse3/CasE, partial [Anaerolineales bacterium]|nr:type I-E CRISPR-associated protein Cas6/Cse3/CasE [Anaerolineales bacterium]
MKLFSSFKRRLAMYLSRLQLNSHSRLMWQKVVNRPYKLHQLVMNAFPDGVTRADANVLHRLEIDAGNAILLVQSEIKPNWDYMSHDLVPPASPFDPLPNPAIREIKDLALEEGRILQFRLNANPTIKKIRHDDNGKRLNSNRVPLKSEEKQLKWIKDKGKAHGFSIRY